MKIENFENVKKAIEKLQILKKKEEQLKELLESVDNVNAKKYFRLKVISKTPLMNDETEIFEIIPSAKDATSVEFSAYSFISKYRRWVVSKIDEIEKFIETL